MLVFSISISSPVWKAQKEELLWALRPPSQRPLATEEWSSERDNSNSSKRRWWTLEYNTIPNTSQPTIYEDMDSQRITTIPSKMIEARGGPEDGKVAISRRNGKPPGVVCNSMAENWSFFHLIFGMEFSNYQALRHPRTIQDLLSGMGLYQVLKSHPQPWKTRPWPPPKGPNGWKWN